MSFISTNTIDCPHCGTTILGYDGEDAVLCPRCKKKFNTNFDIGSLIKQKKSKNESQIEQNTTCSTHNEQEESSYNDMNAEDFIDSIKRKLIGLIGFICTLCILPVIFLYPNIAVALLVMDGIIYVIYMFIVLVDAM